MSVAVSSFLPVSGEIGSLADNAPLATLVIGEI
jgi:hypothetical protein